APEPPRADAKHPAEPPRADARHPAAEPPKHAAAPAAAARRPSLNDAEKQLAAGKTDDAIQTLYVIRRHAPSSPAVALLLGHAYFRKLWRTDGLREYSSAV